MSLSSNDYRKTNEGSSYDKKSDDAYVREYKEFAGVTIIVRTVSNPRAFGSLDSHNKINLQSIRRKSDLVHSVFNTQDKQEQGGDKIDHTGINHAAAAASSIKADNSSNNTNDVAVNEKQR